MPSNWINWFRLSLNWPVVYHSWGENQRSAPGSLQYINWGPSTSPEYFPAELIQCVAFFYLTKYTLSKWKQQTWGFTSSQGTNVRIFNRTHRSFRAKFHLRSLTLPLWKAPGAQSPSPWTSVWAFHPVMFSNSGGKHLRWAGALGSWTSAPYFLMRRFKASHKITPSICFTWWGERKKEKPSKTEYLKMQYLCSWRSEPGPLPWMSFSSFV